MAEVFTQSRAHAMGTRTTSGELLVHRIWTGSSKHGMKHIKSQFKKTKKEKKMPLFLKHLNGWHQNVKCNTHFKKILNAYSYVTTSKKTKHIKKQELKKELFKKRQEVKKKKIEKGGKSD